MRIPRSVVLRTTTLALAVVHSFPARRHLAALAQHPSLSEGWKGFGALLAVALYLLPVRAQARGLFALWQRRRVALTLAGFLLAAAHAVPAFDHIPRLVAAPSWAEAWRGLGATAGVLWFMLPLPIQAWVLTRIVPARPPARAVRCVSPHAA